MTLSDELFLLPGIITHSLPSVMFIAAPTQRLPRATSYRAKRRRAKVRRQNRRSVTRYCYPVWAK